MDGHKNEGSPISQGISQTTLTSASARILANLFACFPEVGQTEEAQADRFRGYLIAVEKFPPVVLEEAMSRILAGTAKIEGERLNPRFMPTPPQIAIVCEDIQRERYIASGNKPKLAYEKPSPPPVQLSPEEQERRRKKVDEALSKFVTTHDVTPPSRNGEKVEPTPSAAVANSRLARKHPNTAQE